MTAFSIAPLKQTHTGWGAEMTSITIDAAAKLGETLIEHAMVEKTTRDTVRLRFATPGDREQFCALLLMAGANKGAANGHERNVAAGRIGA